MSLSIILYLLELFGLAALLLALHRMSERYGIAAFLFVLASVVSVLQGPGTNVVYVDFDYFRMMISPAVLVPCVLMSLLIVYVVDGTATARLVMFGVLLTSLATLLGIRMLAVHLELPNSGTVIGDSNLLVQFKPSLALISSSLLALLVSMVVLMISYQFIRNLLPESFNWVPSGLALMVALAVDGLVFSLVFIGKLGSFELVMTKLLSATLLWPMMALYLRDRETLGERKSMDVVFGSYGHQDIRLRSAQEATRVAEARLKTVVGNTPLVLFTLDAGGRFTWVEGAGLDHLPNSVHLVNLQITSVFGGSEVLLEEAKGGVDQDGVVRVEDRLFELCLRPKFDVTGELAEIHGVATDVTESRQFELALRASENRFQATFDQAPVGLAMLSDSGDFISVNPQLCQMLMSGEAELIGKPFAEVVLESYRTNVGNRFDSVVRGVSSNAELELRVMSSTGDPIEINLTMSGVRTEAGNFDYMIAVIEDIRGRKSAEQELFEAQKLKILGQLTGGVAHDFNNLLTVVMGGLELAMSETSDNNIRKILEPAFRATSRGANLTQQLLSYSRSQSLKAESLDVTPLMKEIREILVRTLPANIAVDLEVEADVAHCIADPSQLQNAILNLALNARDAMEAGGQLTLSAFNGGQVSNPKLDLAPGQYVVLEVRDTGTGIQDSIIDRVYEPFFTTKEVGQGSGLGLSMVYGFAKQSNGAILIESDQGAGTSVRIYLPSAEAPSTVVKIEPGDDSLPYGQGQLVLVVEDDPAVSELVTKQLKKLNYRILQAHTGHEGLALLQREEKPDLLITDIVLPGDLDGAQVADQSLQLLPDLPVIFISGYSRGVLQDRHNLRDHFELLNKPFSMEQLAKSVARALGRDLP